MSNGNNLPKTWTTFMDIIQDDPIVRDTLREAAKAKEIGPRAPAVIYLRAMADAGDAYFEALPEPWSDQAAKKHGDGSDVDADTVTKWAGDPKRYWDKYEYEVSGQKVTGSTYQDMFDRTEDGKAYRSFAKLCEDWNKDGDHSNLPKTAFFNGTEYNLFEMANDRRKDLKAMAESRCYNGRDNLRIVVQIWRNVRDIEKLFKGIVEVDFAYAPAPNADGVYELDNVKKPLELWALSTIKDSPKFGQRTGAWWSMTSMQFANLAPVKVAALDDGKNNAKNLENLKRIKRKVVKSGAGATTSPDTTATDIRVTSNNFGVALVKMATFTEDENSRTSWLNRLANAEPTVSETEITAAVELYDWLTLCITPEWRATHKRCTDTQAQRKSDALAAKLAERNATVEAEAQPTQNQRNAMREQAGEDVKAAQQRAAAANKPVTGRAPQRGGRQQAR